jgi:hypothetical protein
VHLNSKQVRGTFKSLAMTLGALTLAGAHARAGVITQPANSVFCGVYDVCASLMPITAANSATFTSVTDGIVTATSSLTLTGATVPTTWSTWNSPPAVESSTPRVGFNATAASDTLTLSQAVEVFGFELEPDGGSTQTVTVAWLGITGNTLSTETLSLNSISGALLFADDAGGNLIKSVTITMNGGTNGFGLANIRDASALSPTPEPSSFVLLGSALAGLGFFARRRRA